MYAQLVNHNRYGTGVAQDDLNLALITTHLSTAQSITQKIRRQYNTCQQHKASTTNKGVGDITAGASASG
jgi:hypothetical protein